MVVSTWPSAVPTRELKTDRRITTLLQGEVLLETRSHTAWGAGVTAQIYLTCERSLAWQRLTDYSRWVQYFPDLTQSRVLETKADGRKRLYQAASKSFLFITAQAEIWLHTLETLNQRIQFQFEAGSFHDFSADLRLTDWQDGTLLTYSVQATPTIPVPSLFIQQAVQLDLPANMKQMRRELCR